MNHGLKQSSRIIIDKPDLTDGFMIRSFFGRIKNGAIIDEVWLRHPDGAIRLLFKMTSTCRKTDARMQRIGSH